MIPLRLIKGSKPTTTGDEVVEFWKHRKNPRVRWTDESAEEFICKYLRRCEVRRLVSIGAQQQERVQG